MFRIPPAPHAYHLRALHPEPGNSQSARLKAWRHAQQIACTGLGSLCECENNHYRALRDHFRLLAGLDVSYDDLTRTGRVWVQGTEDDTHEAREEYRTLILTALIEHGNRISETHRAYDATVAAKVRENGGMITNGYVVALAKGKCAGKPLDRLTARQLYEILCTVKNRISAREGRGTSRTRNKSQARKGKKP